MAKSTRWVLTQGVNYDLKEGSIKKDSIDQMIATSTKLFNKSYFIAFKPTSESTVEVTDGNENVFEVIKMELPETIWCIQDDYDQYFVGTVLYPSEY